MTREEVIEIVKSAFSAWESEFRVPNDDWSEEHEALDMVIEALKADTVEVVRCKDCRHANECHKSVQYTRNELNAVAIGYSPIEWCSRGERSEECD